MVDKLNLKFNGNKNSRNGSNPFKDNLIKNTHTTLLSSYQSQRDW